MYIYLDHAIMEEISDPGDCCIAMFMVEVDDLLLDDFLSFGATLLIII